MMDMEMNAELEREDESEMGEPSTEGSSAESFFVTLEEDFARLKSEMRENEELTKYEEEYTRLFELLHRTHSKEKELIEEINNLKDDIEVMNQKNAELEKYVGSQNTKINSLHEALETAQKIVDDTNIREGKAHEESTTLKIMIASLEKELEFIRLQHESQTEELGDKKQDKFLNEKETLLNEIEILKYNLEFATSQAKERKKTIDQLLQEKQVLEDNLDTKINEFIQEQRLKEKTECLNLKLREEIEDLNKQIEQINLTVSTSTESIRKLENIIRDKIIDNDLLEKDKLKLSQDNKDMVTKYEALRFKSQTINEFLSDKKMEIQLLNSESKKLSETISKLKAEKEVLMRRQSQMDKQITATSDSLRQANLKEEKYELEYSAMTKSLQEKQIKIDALVKTIEEKSKMSNVKKKIIFSLQSQLKTLEQAGRKVRIEIDDLSKANHSLQKNIIMLTEKKNKVEIENQDLHDKLEDLQNEIKEHRVEMESYKKVASDLDTKHRMQRNMIISMNTEKVSLDKKLNMTLDELDSVKRELKILNDQIKSHKDQIMVRDEALHHNDFQLKKAEKDKEDIIGKWQKEQNNIKLLRKINEELKTTEKELRNEIQLMTMHSSKQKKEIENLRREKENLNTDIMKRSSEIEDLNKKIKVFDLTLQRGEVEYRNRLDEIRLLKLEVKTIRSERNLLIKKIENSSDLRQEVLHLHRDLSKEQLKVAVLTNESEKPVNIHRWRQLTGSDEIIETKKKVSLLNHKILKLSTSLISTEKVLKDAEEKNNSLQEVVDKYFNRDLVKELAEVKMDLRKKDEKIHDLLREINIWRSSKDDHKCEIEKLNKELHEFKEKYFTIKRKYQTNGYRKDLNPKEDFNELLPKTGSEFIITSVNMKS